MHLVVATFALSITLPAMLSCSKSNEMRSKVLIDADSTLEYPIALYDNAEYEKSLDMTRVALAKRLLAATDLQVADIVVKCGFDSPGYFAKCSSKRRA